MTYKQRQLISHMDFSKGTYMSIGRMAKEEGGGRQGAKAAMNIAMRCLELGGKFLFFDEHGLVAQQSA